ncbi:MAG TPA: hypothetical protein VFE47_11735 [Tepidisphaeraceae bacterium]|jgi:hypothetical protein|nr:hypothetical protein [Tepidisphaeraceae bacterium]
MVYLTVEPLIPAFLWLMLAAAAAVLLGWYAWSRPRVVSKRRWGVIITLMAVCLALVLGLLLNPIRVQEIPPPAGKPQLTLLVDATASMNTPDVAGKSRYEAAAKLAEKYAADLGDRFDVRVCTFADSVKTTSAEDLPSHKATGETTDLAAALNSALVEDRPQGQAIALLSDGAHNASDVPLVLDSAQRARVMASPVFTRTFGGDANGFDLGVEIRSPQDLAFIGQKVLVTALITHVGLTGTHPNVMLIQDGKEIASKRADLPTDAPGSVEFWVDQPRSGVYPYEVRVETLPGEMTQANNIASYLLRVVDEPIHVLQLEGKPYWDSKFLMRTLAAVPAVELDSAVRINDNRVMWRTIRQGGSESSTQPSPTTAPAAAPAPAGAAASNSAAQNASSASTANTTPTTGPAPAAGSSPASARIEKWKIVTDPASVLSNPQTLSRYQIIVIGRDAEPFLTEAGVANLQNWVTHSGGALVCYRGSPTAQASERLSRMLPVRWTPSPESRFHLKMTEQGRDMHWLGETASGLGGADTLPRLPSLASDDITVARNNGLAVVLARSAGGDNAPAVVYQPYGTGRVVVIEGAGMWRWAFLPPQFQNEEETYPRLWHSLLRWLVSGTGLMPGQKVMLRAGKLSFSTSEAAGVSLLLREEATRGGLPTVELTNAAGEAKSFVPAAVADEPGGYHVDFGKLPEGHYQARVHSSDGAADNAFGRTAFDVRRFGEEELNLRARPDLMQRIAQGSGGAVLTNDSAGELAQRFAEHLARTRPPRSERTIAWDRWWILALIVVIWGFSWWLRRSAGLV